MHRHLQTVASATFASVATSSVDAVADQVYRNCLIEGSAAGGSRAFVAGAPQ